jgi:hypothetical protein
MVPDSAAELCGHLGRLPGVRCRSRPFPVDKRGIGSCGDHLEPSTPRNKIRSPGQQWLVAVTHCDLDEPPRVATFGSGVAASAAGLGCADGCWWTLCRWLHLGLPGRGARDHRRGPRRWGWDVADRRLAPLPRSSVARPVLVTTTVVQVALGVLVMLLLRGRMARS